MTNEQIANTIKEMKIESKFVRELKIIDLLKKCHRSIFDSKEISKLLD